MSIIRKATMEDIAQIYDLYKIVAKNNPGNLTQEEDEITLDYVAEMVKSGLERGFVFVVDKDGYIISYLKAFTSKFRCLAHVLGDITSMSHPDYQNTGYGAKLWLTGINEIKNNMPHILRVEIVPHANNINVINMYQRIGFKMESECEKKIRNHDDSIGSEVVLTLFNPNFSKEALHNYHKYLLQLIHNEKENNELLNVSKKETTKTVPYIRSEYYINKSPHLQTQYQSNH